ncbi:metallophosphoesterase [Clostridia bacterium]|nr:metallophosphoesterase [Clostridia bacterium]
MKIFAISDLHLSLGTDKPMNIFGNNWENHSQKIATDWLGQVSDDDLVLLPGDHSWGLKLAEAVPDLDFIGKLPGQKVLIKGNHDLWWQSKKKLLAVMHPSMHILQNDTYVYNEWTICGTRGWSVPMDDKFSPEDRKVYMRELLRLKMSLDKADKDKPIIAMLHYPPVSASGVPNEFAKLLEEYGVKICIYGHLHGAMTRIAFEGELHGVQYHLVSADHLGFKLKRLL